MYFILASIASCVISCHSTPTYGLLGAGDIGYSYGAPYYGRPSYNDYYGQRLFGYNGFSGGGLYSGGYPYVFRSTQEPPQPVQGVGSSSGAKYYQNYQHSYNPGTYAPYYEAYQYSQAPVDISDDVSFSSRSSDQPPTTTSNISQKTKYNQDHSLLDKIEEETKHSSQNETSPEQNQPLTNSSSHLEDAVLGSPNPKTFETSFLTSRNSYNPYNNNNNFAFSPDVSTYTSNQRSEEPSSYYSVPSEVMDSNDYNSNTGYSKYSNTILCPYKASASDNGPIYPPHIVTISGPIVSSCQPNGDSSPKSTAIYYTTDYQPLESKPNISPYQAKYVDTSSGNKQGYYSQTNLGTSNPIVSPYQKKSLDPLGIMQGYYPSIFQSNVGDSYGLSPRFSRPLDTAITHQGGLIKGGYNTHKYDHHNFDTGFKRPLPYGGTIYSNIHNDHGFDIGKYEDGQKTFSISTTTHGIGGRGF